MRIKLMLWQGENVGGDEVRSDHIRDQMRRGIVEESVQVLRRHGRSEEEIRSIIGESFHIEEEELNEILNVGGK